MYDVVLILGYRIDENGKQPKEQILRINKGVELFKKKQAKHIMTACGFGKHFNRTSKSLAWHMKKFAIKKGVPPEKIIIEDKSTSTLENIIFSKPVIDKHKWKSIIIVSSRYHIRRIKMICKYIFSKNYKLKFVGVKSTNDNRFTLKIEREKYNKNKEWLDKFICY